jgi:IS30 family transposase
MAPMSLKPSDRYLSLAEREEIAVGVAAGDTQVVIARRLGRSPSTVSRELRRNTMVRAPGGYRAVLAQSKADQRSKRPKVAKLVAIPRLRQQVQGMLEQRFSPQQITHRLPLDFPDDADMRVSHEAIYQSLFVQGRGALRRELAACLRTGRTLRRPRARASAAAQAELRQIKDMVMISERPAEVEDRAVPGHFEGDLIVGADNGSAIGTLVERSTRFTMLLHLPGRRDAATVRDAIAAAALTMPEHLRRSLTWDQGRELARHTEITMATGMPIYFCDPHSPWQRGSNENTNGLLRQYFPKGTDLSVHTAEHLQAVAAELNARPRKTLDWATPAEKLSQLLSPPQPDGVATTT